MIQSCGIRWSGYPVFQCSSDPAIQWSGDLRFSLCLQTRLPSLNHLNFGQTEPRRKSERSAVSRSWFLLSRGIIWQNLRTTWSSKSDITSCFHRGSANNPLFVWEVCSTQTYLPDRFMGETRQYGTCDSYAAFAAKFREETLPCTPRWELARSSGANVSLSPEIWLFDSLFAFLCYLVCFASLSSAFLCDRLCLDLLVGF